MRCAIEPDQKRFFHKQGWLELEGFLQESEREKILKTLKQISNQQLGSSFEKGRFLSRFTPDIARLIRKTGWAEIVFELNGYKPLRLAYDHFFQELPKEGLQVFQEMLNKPGTTCGLLLCLDGNTAGNGRFFYPGLLMSLPIVPHCHYLLIVFNHFYLPSQYPIVYE